jgi:gliding motility-associated-like protein
MKKNLSKAHFFVCLIIFSGIFTAKAQGPFRADNSDNKKATWSATLQPPKVFIENKGQFKVPAISEMQSPVHFAYDDGSTKILFTPKGLVYYFSEKRKVKEKEAEEIERERKEKVKSVEEYMEKEREERAITYKRDLVSAEWEGANQDVEIISEGQAPDYFSYVFYEGGVEKNVNYIYGYKKIIYKNLYPNIDVEYTFHPSDGIKYALILHPGADPSQVKLKYSDKVKITDNGDVYVSTLFGSIVDHAPLSFYENNRSSVINSRFVKDGKTISFQLDNYDNSKTVVIDPWTQTPAINNSKGVWECERDGAGNAYIIAGDSPMKLLKYNAAGALQWTYVTPYDTATGWLGTLATDLAGNSYVTMGSTAQINKVNNAGSSLYNVTGGSMDEYWDITFNCDQTKLIVGGTRLNAFPTVLGYGTIFDINTGTGAVTATKNVGYTSPGPFGINNPDEVRAITSSHNAKYYYMTLDSLGSFDQNFSACPTATTLFKINSTYALGYKCEDWRPKGNSGIAAMKANKNFLYTQNGTTVHKRSLGSGAILASAAIPGGVSTASMGSNQPGNSGIDLDSCGNVYVGSSNAVIKYDANLNQLSSSAVPFKVYDVAVSTGGNVIVCGATGVASTVTRTGYVESFAMGACDPSVLQCCDATICPAGPFCNTAPSVTLTPVTPGGTWSGAGMSAGGVFNPATAGPGVHEIVYTLACGKDSIAITVNACASLTVCVNGSTLNVSGGTPSYTWSVYNSGGSTPITTQAQCTACNSSYTWFGGQCLNGFTPVTTCSTSPSWQQVGTGASITTPTTTPIKVVDNAGNSYTITTIGSLPSCTTTCATPTVTIVSSQSVTCFGASTGSATVNATPAGTYTYTWQTGNLNGAAQTGLAAGVYTVTASAGACSGTVSVNITQPSAPLSGSITANTPASCGANNGILTVTPAGGTPAYTYTWAPTAGNSSTLSNLAGGTYTVTIKDANNCSTTVTATVATTSTPTLTVNSATVCAGTSTTLTVNGATTYSWAPATGLSSTTNATVTATPTVTTIYTVTGTAGTCSSTATSTVTVNAVPTATATGTALVCTGQPINLGVTTTATTFSWSGPNTFTSNVQNPTIVASTAANSGVYTVTVTANGCTAVSTISVTVTNSTSVTITPAGPYCSGNLPTNLSASVAGGTWSGTGITNATNGTFDPAVAGPGTYTITYTIGGSCGSSDSTVITVNPGPTATAGASTTLACVGQTINLDVITTATTYTWSGPGGFNSNAQNPVIASAALTGSGIYTVTVTAGGCTGTDTINITVVSSPTVTVNSATMCAGTSSTLTAVGATTYTWSPAIGLSSTSGNTVTATPATTTIYTVTGSVGGCISNPATSTVTVNPSPTITVNNSTSICTNTSVTLTVSGASTYNWSPATGLNTATGAIVIATPAASTTYTITGTDVNGCIGTATVTVQNSPSITSTVTTNSVTCNGLGNGNATVVAAGGTGPFTYAWSPVGGTNATTGNISAGNYTCTITDSIGCISSATVAVLQPPTLSVTVASGVICVGQSYTLDAIPAGGTSPYTYNWNGGASTTNPYVVSPAVATSYTVVVIDANGCVVTDNSIVIGVRPPLQVTAGDLYICSGNSGTLTAVGSGGDGTYTYHWMPGNLNGSSVSVSPAATTIYTVTISDGCTSASATDTALVNVTPPPVIPLPIPASGCAPVCVNFTNPTGLVNWMWDFGDGTTSNGINPRHCYTTAGSFNVSISYTSTIGCASTVTSAGLVTVYPVPQALFAATPNPTDIINPQVIFYNQSVNSNSWQWTFGDGSSSTGYSPSHTYAAPGSYPVVLIAQSAQGCSDTIREIVIVNDIFTFYAPNAFSPNEDVMNEIFLPTGEGWDNSTFNMWIYDRWGNLIFKTQDLLKGWDGRIHSKGDVVQEDTYVWKVQLNDIFGKQHSYTGVVSVVK